jgi:hypothetical protein
MFSKSKIRIAVSLAACVGLIAAAPSSVRWQDPAEGAFAVTVPSGWQVKGGTVRVTRIEPHYVVRAQSPDGGVQLFMDDPRIAIREIPNAMTQRMGWREGQAIPAAWGGKLLLERYEPAPQMAAEYVRKGLCQSPTMMQGGIIPSQTQSLNAQMAPIAQAEGKRVHVDVGEVSFKCGSQIGYVYAITAEASQPGAPVAMWLVYRIAGYLASQQDTGSAATAMHTMLETFEMNPAWLQRFAQELNDTTGNVIRESNAITQSTIQRAKQQDAEMADQYAAWKKNSDATMAAIDRTGSAVTGSSSTGSGNANGNGHDYNQQLGTKKVCDNLDRCQTVDASIDTWYSDCSGTFYPGNNTGGPPPASVSACWSKGH